MALKIAFLIPGFSDGGAQRQCIMLLNALQAEPDLELRLIHFYDGVHFDMLRHDRIAIERFGNGRTNYDPRNLWLVWRALRRNPPDVIITWQQACDVYGYVLRRILPGLAWVMTERDSAYPKQLRFELRRRLGRNADVIVANSKKGATYWQAAGAMCDIVTVPNIVPVNDVASPPLPATPRVLTVGRLEVQKNPRTVIAAFVQLAREHPALELAVIGAGTEEVALRAIATEGGVEDRIEFLGFRKDVPQQLAKATLVVSMSNHEGLPNVMLETVASGRLAVVSDIPEHRELFGPDYPFYVADRTNPAAVAAAVERALAAPDNIRLLEFAQSRLLAMKPEMVGAAYKDIFLKIAARSEGSQKPECLD